LSDKHDLIHKAVGWMLREVGKRDEGLLRKYLDKNYARMSRTTLRYAIERLPEEFRQYYLNR
jgi:3-methyladenine DNA glycosylase AlkD